MNTHPLGDRHEIPLLGLGVWQVDNGREAVDAVRWALEEGYRHIDTAQATATRRASASVSARAECHAKRSS